MLQTIVLSVAVVGAISADRERATLTVAAVGPFVILVTGTCCPLAGIAKAIKAKIKRGVYPPILI
jgi:hypothetical protein